MSISEYSLLTGYPCELCMGSPNFEECTASAADAGDTMSVFDNAGNPNDAQPNFPLVVGCGFGLCEGRRPAALAEPVDELRSVGAALARSAYLEAASVVAFLDLLREGCVRETWGAACAVARSERARVAEEGERAIAELTEQLERAVPESWHRSLGFPSPRETRAMLAEMGREIWKHGPLERGARAPSA